MSAWNLMSYESKANLLEAVRRESTGMFALAEESESETGTWPHQFLGGFSGSRLGGFFRI